MKTLCPAVAVAIAVAAAVPVNAATIGLTGTIRDFKDTHPDFEFLIATDPGIVESTLGADGKPVYAGVKGNPTTTGKMAFDQWYRDTAGVNTKKSLSITLDNTITPDPEIYTFADSSFFPIDGELFGNEGRSHNYHFTYELHTRFTYTGGETFSFTGDDDLWVFINDTLAIDLGGVHGPLSSSVSLDAIAATLGITTGSDYDLDIFFAERHTAASNFRIDTSILLEQPQDVPEPSTMLGVGAAVGLGVLRRKQALRQSS
ncbi:MAG: PEP-CTERM sorting domain-containing protein [Cyanobacteria bacterium J06639_1]